MDFTELRIEGERFHLLVIQDDFSRFVVGYRTAAEASAEVVIAVLSEAIARYGKPETIRSDRGGAFTGKELSDFCDRELIDHIVGHSYHPQGGGKVESMIGTVKRELWEVEHFENRTRAEQRLAEFFLGFNEQRAHMGIDGLTPADRYFGRADRVLAAINALSRRRHAALAVHLQDASATEEVLAAPTGAPLEVLRLVIVDGQMELRFCGARVRLGALEP
jgi:RNA-directed DNA polymerase